MQSSGSWNKLGNINRECLIQYFNASTSSMGQDPVQNDVYVHCPITGLPEKDSSASG